MERLKWLMLSSCVILVITVIAFNQKLIEEREQKSAAVESDKPKSLSFKQFAETNGHSQTEVSIQKLFEEYTDKHINDEAIQAFYESDKNPFMQKVARSSHILISTHNKMTIEERKKKFELSQEIYQKAKSGTDFTQLAIQYSDDYLSAKKGGDLGWLPEGSINAQFSKQVFQKMKSGQISKPFQSKFGFHIVKLTEQVKEEKKPLEDVKHHIQNLLMLEADKERKQILGMSNDTLASNLASNH